MKQQPYEFDRTSEAARTIWPDIEISAEDRAKLQELLRPVVARSVERMEHRIYELWVPGRVSYPYGREACE